MKRILWILNRKELMESEVYLLRILGNEVYIPKKPPFDMEINVDWESDKLLSIPQEDLDELNNINFYEDILTRKQAALINKYFDVAMFTNYPQTIESMVDWFKGILILRAHGLEKIEGTYTDLIVSQLGLCYIKKIQELGNRFVFGESFDGLSKKECEFFKNHAIYMPIGLSDRKIRDGWTGEKKKLLFICPGIKFSDSYNKIYNDFKKEFRDVLYSIGGFQPIKIINDKNVLDDHEQHDIDSLYYSYSCLYYESTAENRISYAPFEAIRHGMPLVFMGGGLIDKLGGKNLPGRCKSVVEAKNKIKKLYQATEGL